MLGNKQGEARSTGSGSHASPQSRHRGLEVRRSREQALLSRWKSWHLPATSYQQIVLHQDGADRRTALQTSRFRIFSCLFFSLGYFVRSKKFSKAVMFVALNGLRLANVNASWKLARWR